MAEDAVELFQTAVSQNKLSLALGGVLDLDFRPQPLGKIILQLADIRVHAPRRSGRIFFRQLVANKRFCLAH